MKDNNKMQIESNYGAVISARTLHEKLQVESAFSLWWKNLCKRLGYATEEFASFEIEKPQGQRGQNRKDYWIPIDIARNMCLASNGRISKIIATHLSEMEALFMAPQQRVNCTSKCAVHSLSPQKEIREQPKIVTKEVCTQLPKTIEFSSEPILIDEYVKLLHRHGIDIRYGHKILREMGFLHANEGMFNVAKDRFVTLGLFEIKEHKSFEGVVIGRTTLVTRKGQEYLLEPIVLYYKEHAGELREKRKRRIQLKELLSSNVPVNSPEHLRAWHCTSNTL